MRETKEDTHSQKKRYTRPKVQTWLDGAKKWEICAGVPPSDKDKQKNRCKNTQKEKAVMKGRSTTEGQAKKGQPTKEKAQERKNGLAWDVTGKLKRGSLAKGGAN